MRYTEYSEYNPTGIEWLPQAPAHWQIKGLRHICRFAYGDSLAAENREEGEVAVYGSNGQVGTHDTSNTLAPVIVVGRKGSFGKLNYSLKPVFAIDTTYFIDQRNCLEDLDWLAYALQPLKLDEASKDSAVPGLAREDAYKHKLPVPPLDEQQTIARFLDAKTGQIDVLVAQKRQLIAKLKEKRSALIARTVTRGLPPEAAKAAGLEPAPAMKDSGVEWLGQIPVHWEIEKFSREVHIAEGQVDPEIEPFASMYLIAPNHIESGMGRLLALETAAEQFAESGKYLCPADAVIYSKIRPALRKVVIAPEKCLCSADMYPLTSKKKILNPYLYWLLLSDQFSAWSVLEADRVAMPKINRETLNALRLPIPPQNEQLKIVEYLAAETAKVDRMLEKVEAVISSLTEYRQALITSAVTGKIDVRAVPKLEMEVA